MSASLVGSEMCIRDSSKALERWRLHGALQGISRAPEQNSLRAPPVGHQQSCNTRLAQLLPP
eukprot:1828210-Alexandrium_andersonii.AAC.1